VSRIGRWASTNSAIVRLWSGGGAEYARHVHGLVSHQLSVEVASFESKFRLADHDETCVERATVFVDDDTEWIFSELEIRGIEIGLEHHVRVFEPQAFIKSVDSGTAEI
jgi:hypothetical protein